MTRATLGESSPLETRYEVAAQKIEPQSGARLIEFPEDDTDGNYHSRVNLVCYVRRYRHHRVSFESRRFRREFQIDLRPCG